MDPHKGSHTAVAVGTAKEVLGQVRVRAGTAQARARRPGRRIVVRDEAGAELAADAHRFVSRLAASRYLGYLKGQKAAMTGQPGAHSNGPELVAGHGYDTKYAMHALRLGLQGTKLLSTGRVTCSSPRSAMSALVASKIRRPSSPSMATSAKSHESGDWRAAVSMASDCR